MLFRIDVAPYFENMLALGHGGDHKMGNFFSSPEKPKYRNFVTGKDDLELALEDPVPGLQLFQRSELEEPYFRIDVRAGGHGKKSFFVPDYHWEGLFPIVSQRFIDVLNRMDDFPHQYWPCKVVDKGGRVLETEPMYWLNIRRLFHVTPDGSKFWEPIRYYPKKWKVNLRKRTMTLEDGPETRPLQNTFTTTATEEERIATIQARPEVRAILESVPIWCLQVGVNSRSVFFNEAFFDAVMAEGLTHFKESSSIAPSSRENVGHV